VTDEWENRRPGKKESTGKEHGRAADVGLTAQLSGVTIYIYVAIVLGKWLKSLGSRNMSDRGKP
jgi:hypothetical protein